MKIDEIIFEDVDSDTAQIQSDITSSVQRQEQTLVAQFNDLKAMVTRECQPFLKEIGGIDNMLFHRPLYRGIPSSDYKKLKLGLNKPVQEITVRTDRIPMDTPGAVSSLIDNWFQKKTGIRFRSAGLFCTGRLYSAIGYGVAAIVIPKGNFHYCWSPLYKDMYEELGPFVDTSGEELDQFSTTKQKIGQFFSGNSADRKIKDFLETGDYHFDSGFTNALQSSGEIMISCEQAFIVDTDWSSNLHFYLLHNKMPPTRKMEPL